MAKKKKQPAPAPKRQASAKPAKKEKPQQKAKQLLRKFTEKGPGSKVTKKEVKKVIKRTDAAPKRILKADKSAKDIKLAGPARKYVKSLLPKSQVPVEPAVTEEVGGSPAVVQNEGGGIFEPIAAHEVDIANIYADADKYIADAEVRGIDISTGRSLEGTKYAADKESEWRTAVANIEVKGRLDLQPIINAGLEKVADIEGQAQRDVADITGRYDVEGVRVRSEADKQIGGMQLAGSMYNLLNAAFG